MNDNITDLQAQIRALQAFRGVTFNRDQVAITEGIKPRSRRIEMVAAVPSTFSSTQPRMYSAAAQARARVGLQCALLAASAPSSAHARLAKLMGEPFDVDAAAKAPVMLTNEIVIEFTARQIILKLTGGAYTALTTWVDRSNKALALAKSAGEAAGRAAAQRASAIGARGERMDHLDELLHQIALGRFGDGMGKDSVFHTPAAQEKLDELRRWINDMAENNGSSYDGAAGMPALQEAA